MAKGLGADKGSKLSSEGDSRVQVMCKWEYREVTVSVSYK